MRRAIQRCSTPLLRTLTPRYSGNASHRLDVQWGITIFSPARQIGAAGLHQTSRARQGAAAATQAQQSDDAASSLITRFDELESRRIVHPNVIRAITKDMRLETMTDVQTKTVNEALHGDDIIAQAKTGTGKTLAFLLPILQNIISVDPQLAEPSGRGRRNRTTADDIRALIISPTRELAEQIAEEARKLVRHTGLIVQTAVGGSHKRSGLAAIQNQGCHILVGTPGRLKDILSDSHTRVQAPDLSALVFDEADRLLDQGFWPEIQEIMHLLPTTAEHDRQTMMFSATVPKTVVDLVRSTLKPGFQFVKCVGDNEEPTHERVPQHLVRCIGLENGLPVLTELCSNAIAKSKEPDGRPFKAIVYFNSTAEVGLAAEMLRRLRTPGEQVKPDAFGDTKTAHPWNPTRIFDIHAKLTQGQRTFAADAFRKANSAILLSSDVTARGMDFPNVTHVIQVGLPTTTEQYIHRIGRTARAGKEGEGWLILNQIESAEGQRRLRRLPLRRDESLVTAKLDLKEAAQVPADAGTVLRMLSRGHAPGRPRDQIQGLQSHAGRFPMGPRQTSGRRSHEQPVEVRLGHGHASEHCAWSCSAVGHLATAWTQPRPRRDVFGLWWLAWSRGIWTVR